jgi:hypothetical protein
METDVANFVSLKKTGYVLEVISTIQTNDLNAIQDISITKVEFICMFL